MFLCGQLQDALKLALEKDAEATRLHGENRVLLEKVTNYEVQIKSAAAAPKPSDAKIEAIVAHVKKANIFQPGGDTKTASILHTDPFGGLTALVTQLSGLLAPAPAAGEPIEKSAATTEDAKEFKPWALTLAHGAA